MDIQAILKSNPCWFVVDINNRTVVKPTFLYDDWKVMAWYGDEVEEVPREQVLALCLPPRPKNASKI